MSNSSCPERNLERSESQPKRTDSNVNSVDLLKEDRSTASCNQSQDGHISNEHNTTALTFASPQAYLSDDVRYLTQDLADVKNGDSASVMLYQLDRQLASYDQAFAHMESHAAGSHDSSGTTPVEAPPIGSGTMRVETPPIGSGTTPIETPPVGSGTTPIETPPSAGSSSSTPGDHPTQPPSTPDVPSGGMDNPVPPHEVPRSSTNPALPDKVEMMEYWPFNDHVNIQQILATNPKYNVLDYVGAIPSGNGNADMTFNGAPEPNLAGDIADWKASGRTALLAISAQGANGVGINLRSDSDVTNFVSSISKMIDTYGFQGIDWDLEDSFTQSSSDAVVKATQQLKDKYGPDFIVAAVPRDYEVRNNGIWAQTMKAMGDNLDLLGVQEYDNAVYADPNFAQIKTDYADLIAQGFPADKILLGTSTTSGVSISGGAGTPEVYGNALRYLQQQYGVRGAWVWQSNSDFSDQPSWSYENALADAMGLG